VELEPELLHQLLEYLRAHGYPDDSFVLEWPVSQEYQADLAVVDVATWRPIALFELKASDSEPSKRLGRTQLRTFAKALGSDVLLYLVYPRTGSGRVALERVLPGRPPGSDREIPSVPAFSLARSTERGKAQASLAEKRRVVVDRFAWTCRLLSVTAAALALLDFRGVIQLTAERITFIGIVIGLWILPFTSKLKFLGWEFERSQSK
jgi:hypothetical protein